MAYGTLSTLDTLASIRQTVVEYGEDRAWDSIRKSFMAHNAQMNEMITELADRTTDTRRSYGTGDVKTFEILDQWGLPDAQKISAAATVDFPLDRHGNSLQWTRQWMIQNTVEQLAAETNGILDGDVTNVIRRIKQAVFLSSNYTFTDKLGVPAGVVLNVKAFANNDGSAYPVGPNGEVFATSHNHYLANATLTTTAASNLILAVQEHVNVGTPVVVISATDEAAWRALTGFQPYVDSRLTLNANANQPVQRLNYSDLFNRAIGIYGNAEIRIRPWAIAGYAFAYVENQPPVLGLRIPARAPGLGDLQLVYEDERYPLHARSYERQFGVGVWNRVGGAVLDFGHGSYTNPTI